MDLELDLGPSKICEKDRTEGPFLAEDRWPDLGPKNLDTLPCHACKNRKQIIFISDMMFLRHEIAFLTFLRRIDLFLFFTFAKMLSLRKGKFYVKFYCVPVEPENFSLIFVAWFSLYLCGSSQLWVYFPFSGNQFVTMTTRSKLFISFFILKSLICAGRRQQL